jgi:tetratricopeptide (TPR) repeat protein
MTESAPFAEPREPAEIGPRLARANLLRMRGRWAEAADECVAALRQAPDHPTAHSLLGDIYQDQGRPDEARHWYHLALELNPASEADRAKLQRAEEALEARSRRAEWTAVIEGRAQSAETTLLVRESLQRIGAIAGAGVCGIILVMATLVSVAERRGGPDDLDAPLFARNPRAAAAANPDTWRERALLRRVKETAGPGAALAARVELDPRGNGATLRVFLPRKAREGLTAQEASERVLREAYRLARTLRDAAVTLQEREETTRVIHVFVVGPSHAAYSSGDTELLMIGVITHNDLVVDPQVVTGPELLTFFSRIAPPQWYGDLAGL